YPVLSRGQFFTSCVSLAVLLSPVLLSSAAHTTHSSTLSLHDALPICRRTGTATGSSTGMTTSRPAGSSARTRTGPTGRTGGPPRSEEHTSELQSRFDLVCRLLLEKKKTTTIAAADVLADVRPAHEDDA